MSLPGTVFMFVFLQNVAFAWFVGLPEESSRARKGRAPAVAIVFSTSLFLAMASFLASKLTHRLGIHDALPPLLVALGALLSLLAESLARRFLKEKPPVIREWVRDAEGSGVAFAVALAVSGRALSMTMAFIAALSALGGYLAFAWAFRGILERLRLSPVPRSMKGVPIVLLSAALVSFAFMAVDSGFIVLLAPR